MRSPQSRCQTCVKARNRELRQLDPDAARARDHRNYQKLMADPARAARRRETQRENSAAYRHRHAKQAT